jgi:hypothetical protein
VLQGWANFRPGKPRRALTPEFLQSPLTPRPLPLASLAGEGARFPPLRLGKALERSVAPPAVCVMGRSPPLPTRCASELPANFQNSEFLSMSSAILDSL